MSSLNFLTLAQARDGLVKKEFTATELVEAHINYDEKINSLNCYVTKTYEQATEDAKKADERIQNCSARPMEGLPIAIKDLYCTKGIRTTASSKMLENFIPPYESTVTQNLFNAGAIMLGKTSMDEFAMGSTNMTSHFGKVINPWKRQNDTKDLAPGGSSGGSAAIVAGYGALAATASDTGGSIRQPAAFCGIAGIKPTYGLCSRWGMVAFASSLDQAGPVARTIRDNAIMLTHMASYDQKDSTSLNVLSKNYEESLGQSIKGKKIGIPKEYFVSGMDEDIIDSWEKGKEILKSLGAEIHEVSLPHTKYALPAYYIIAPAEASSNLSRYDGVRYTHRVDASGLDELYELTRAEGFGSEVKRRILMGTYVLSAGYYDAYYIKAKKIQKLIQKDFENVFKQVDVILTPTTPSAAFGFDEIPTDPVEIYLNDILTVSINLAGLPALSLPATLNKNGLPLGLQLIGPKLGEDIILQVGDAMEKELNFPFLK